MSKTILDKINKHINLIIIFIVSTLYLIIIINPLHSLTSPIYGGDYYYQLGSINHIINGGNPIASSNSLHEIPAYMPLYSSIMAYSSLITGLDPITVIYSSNFIFVFLSLLIMYYLILKLFNNKKVALITSIMYLTTLSLPIQKYTIFAAYITAPLFFLSLYEYHKKNSLKNKIFLGIMYGLSAISHAMLFISTSLFLISYIIFFHLISIKDKNNKINLAKIKGYCLDYCIVILIATPIILLWWYYPIFYFKGKVAESYITTNFQKFTLSFQISLIKNLFHSLFLNSSSISSLIFSGLTLLGLGTLLLIKRKDENIKFTLYLVFSSFIIYFHYFITENILGFSFIPTHLMQFTFLIIRFFLIGFGIKVIINKLKIKYITIIFVIITIFMLFSSYKQITNNKWYQVGKNTIPEPYNNFSTYFKKNIDVNDVILTTKELGFAINAVSGAKLLSFRRGHVPPFQFEKLDKRELISALILYGNNSTEKLRLIKENNIKYIYWDYYWINSEYNFDKSGNIINWYDPLILLNQSLEKELRRNNITYFKKYTWVDPANRAEGIPKYNLLFISPYNYHNYTNPWKTNLNPYLEEVWSYKKNGKEIAKLYKVNPQ